MSFKYSPESPLHEASLVDYSLHSPALLQLLETKISRTLIDYIVDCTCETVDLALGRNYARSAGPSRGRGPSKKSHHQFVADIIHRAEVKLPVLLVALVYIDRARAHLEIALDQFAFERVFLGGIIIANKYLNDSTLKNVHWAMCSRIFRTRDIGRIEREFLDVLDFELGVSEADILSHHASIISLTYPQRTCLLQSAGIVQPKRRQQHRRVASEASSTISNASTIYIEDVASSGGSSSSTSSVMDLDEPVRKVTSFRPRHDTITQRSEFQPQVPQGEPLQRTQARAFSRPPLTRKPTPYVHAPVIEPRRLSIPSAFSIFRNLPIFHYNAPNSESPTESESSGSLSASSESDDDAAGTSATMSAMAIGF